MKKGLLRHASRIFSSGIAASVMMACPPAANVSSPVTNSLGNGRSGNVTFESVTSTNPRDFLLHCATANHPQAQEQSPAEVAAFLKAAFEASQGLSLH